MQDSHDPSSVSADAASPVTDRSVAALSSAHAPEATAACAEIAKPPEAPAGRSLTEPPLAVQSGFRWTMALVAAGGCFAGAGQALVAGTPWPYVGLACAFWALLVAGLANYARLSLPPNEDARADPSAS